MLALYKQHGLPPRVPAYSLLHDHQARLTTGHSSSLSKKDLKGNSSSGSGSGSSGSSGDSALAGGTPGGPTDAASLFPTVPSAKATKTTTKTTTTSAQQQSPQYSNELEAQLLASLLAPPLPPPVHNTLWPLPTGVSTNLGGRPKEAAAAVSPPLLPLPVSSKQATRVPAVPSSSSSDVAPTPSSGLQPATTTPLCGSAFSHFQPTTVPVPKQATDAPAPSSKADGASTPLSSPSEAAAAAAAMADQPRATHCRPAITLDLFLTPAKPPCTERGEEEQALTQQRPTEIGAMMEGGLPPLPLLSPAEVRAQTVPLPPPIASFLRGEGLPAILSNSDVSSAVRVCAYAGLFAGVKEELSACGHIHVKGGAGLCMWTTTCGLTLANFFLDTRNDRARPPALRLWRHRRPALPSLLPRTAPGGGASARAAALAARARLLCRRRTPPFR